MHKKSRNWLLGGAAVLVVIVLAVVIGFPWLEQRVKLEIAEKISESPQFDCGEIDLSLRNGSISFSDAVLELDLADAARHLQVKSGEIKLEGIKWFPLIFSKKLKIRDLYIDRPFVVISEMTATDSLPAEKPAPKNGLSNISIAHIRADKGHFKMIKNPADTAVIMMADTFDLAADGIALDILDGGGVTHSVGQVLADIRSFVLHSGDNLFKISLDQFSLNKQDSSIVLTSLKVKPKFQKQAFFQQIRFRQGRLDFEFPEVVIRGWQFDQLLQGRVAARTVVVNDMALHVVVNQNVPVDPNGYKPLLHEALLQTKLGISIDSVLVNRGGLELEVIAVGKSAPGFISFDPLDAVITNVTNDSALIREQPLLTVAAVGHFQKKHRVDHHFWFDLSSPDYAFSFKGKASEIPFSGFNSLLSPVANVVFESGQISALDFDVNANKTTASGSLRLDYTDLGFHLMNENKKKKKFLSGIVNLFVKNENDGEAEDFERGKVSVQRDTTRPFFNFWWEAIQSGLKNSILKEAAKKRIDKKESR